MKTLEETGAKADAKVAPHLKPSLLSSRKHSGWSQRLSTHKHLEPRVQELFLRSKFGAIKGTPMNLRKHSEGEPFTCPLCKTSILNTEPTPKLHGHQWTDHALHHCDATGFKTARKAVQDALSTKLTEIVTGGGEVDMRVHITSLTERTRAENTSQQPALPVNDVVVDLRGYLPADFSDTANLIGLTLDDLTGMFNAARRQLQDLMKLVDKQPRT